MGDNVNPMNLTAIRTTAIGVGGTALVVVVSQLVQIWLLKKRLKGKAPGYGQTIFEYARKDRREDGTGGVEMTVGGINANLRGHSCLD